MVENFGIYIKHERELRGVPLEEIADTTKIHIRFLKAIEKNQFDDLPGEVFIKGYIRSYAKTIGSNAEEILKNYENSAGKKRLEKIQKTQAEKDRRFLKKKETMGFIAVGCFLLVLLAIGNFIFQKVHNEQGEVDPPVTSPSGPVEHKVSKDTEKQKGVHKGSDIQIKKESSQAKANSSAPSTIGIILSSNSVTIETSSEKSPPVAEKKEVVLEEPKETQPPQPNGDPGLLREMDANPLQFEQNERVQLASIRPVSQNGDQPETTPSASISSAETIPLNLKIKVKENSWFNLTIDGSQEQDFILAAGSEKNFSGQDEFRITIGNRKGVDVFLNERGLMLPESSDDVVRNFIINTKLIE